MWVTKDGAHQLIEDATLDYWNSLGWVEYQGDPAPSGGSLPEPTAPNAGQALRVNTAGDGARCARRALPASRPHDRDQPRRRGSATNLPWTEVASAGSSVEIDGVDSTLINILEDGVYAVSMVIEVDSSDATEYQFDLQPVISEQGEHWDDYGDFPTNGERDSTVSASFVFHAGDTLQPFVWLGGGTLGGTASNGHLVVARLAALT